MTRYAIGDIHGGAKTFRALLEKSICIVKIVSTSWVITLIEVRIVKECWISS